jgi:hypothetical protein
MLVDVRWIILTVVAGGIITLAVLQPHLIPALALGVSVIGLLYLLLRLGEQRRQDDQ